MELDCFGGADGGFDIGCRIPAPPGLVGATALGTVATGVGVAAVPALAATVVESFLTISEAFAVGASGSVAFTTDDGEGGTRVGGCRWSAAQRSSGFATLAVTTENSFLIASAGFADGASAGITSATGDGGEGTCRSGCTLSAEFWLSGFGAFGMVAACPGFTSLSSATSGMGTKVVSILGSINSILSIVPRRHGVLKFSRGTIRQPMPLTWNEFPSTSIASTIFSVFKPNFTMICAGEYQAPSLKYSLARLRSSPHATTAQNFSLATRAFSADLITPKAVVKIRSKGLISMPPIQARAGAIPQLITPDEIFVDDQVLVLFLGDAA